MTQDVLSSAPSLTTASISIHMCRLNFVQIVRKVFSIPLRCKIYEQGNCKPGKCEPPTITHVTEIQPVLVLKSAPVQGALAYCPSQDYQMIGQRPKTCLIKLAFADCFGLSSSLQAWGLSRARDEVWQLPRNHPLPIQDPSIHLRLCWTSCLRERSKNR